MEYKRTARAVGVLVIALGVLVVVGWVADIQVFKSVIPGFSSMKFNTALCFIFAGICMLSMRDTQRGYLSYIFAAPLIFIGVLSIFQDIGDVNLGIDNLLYHDYSAITHPGRMSPTTAFCFVLLGIAFFL